MGEINSFPIQTKKIEDLDLLSSSSTTDQDQVLIYDESVGVWKKQTISERDKKKVIPIDSIANFPNLDVDGYSPRQQFILGSFAPDGDSGGGILLWEPDLPKSLHNGVNYFSPTVPIPADFNNPTDVQNYLDGVGEEWPAGDGVFVLNYFVSKEEFDLVQDRIVSVVANLSAMSPSVGQQVSTKGCLSVGDGGHGIFIAEAASGTPDGYGRVLAANGLHWVIEKTLGGVIVEQFGAKGDNSTVNSASLQAAIDYLAGLPGEERGGVVYFGSGIYLGNITLEDRVFLKGAGRGATVLKSAPGSNLDVITIPTSANLIGWCGLTVDGNAANNTAGSGIVTATVGSSNGNSFSPYTDKTSSSDYSYKHLIAYDFTVGNCAEHGILTEPSNFQIFMDNFACSHNLGDGLWVRSSDGIYSNFYCEKNGRSGLYASGSANKFASFKTIWNGRTDNTYGGLREQGSYNTFHQGESQDNYTDGIQILGTGPEFKGCSANTNGYLAVGSEGFSSGIHADVRVGSTASRIKFSGEVHTYKLAVGTDGLWTTQWPYYFNSYAAAQIDTWDIKYNPATYNERPNINVEFRINKNTIAAGSLASSNTQTYYDVSPSTEAGTGDAIVRLFRTTLATVAKMEIHIPNTATVNHRINGGGEAAFCLNAGDVQLGNGAWNGQRTRLGNYYFWVDASARLRIKNGAPTSDTDGTIVGTQT